VARGLSIREVLLAAILEFLSKQDRLALGDIRAVLEREIDAAGADELQALKRRLGADHGWAYHEPDPIARRIHHVLSDHFLTADSELIGGDRLTALGGAPLIIVSNHLSYADANVIEVLLQRGGAGNIADRLTALAGPKIFTSVQRRFSSLCFGTVKVAQSADVATGEAAIDVRAVARAARQAIDAAMARLDAGDALLLFGEGTRSRSGAMQPMLPAAARYFEKPGTWVVPAGLIGSEAMFPVGELTLQPARATLRIGVPVLAEECLARGNGDRKAVMDALGADVAALLPEPYRGAYAG
jgi:1-acyl-sn-glycerol-3-phosphate acyltransferase